MEIRLELNQRYSRGFQLRLVHGPMNKVYDEEPWTMYEAGACAGMLLEMLNKELGSSYQPHQVLRVTQEAIEANAKNGDFTAIRMLQDIQTKKFDLSIPDKCDYRKEVVDGKEEIFFSGRGAVLITYFSWTDEKKPKAREVLRHYCEYIAAHGYRGGATKALAELEGLGKEDAVSWIKRTYARYIQDDTALIQYILA